MLDGHTYPLYKVLRDLDYDFVRGVHNNEGVDRWVRVVAQGVDDAANLIKELDIFQ